MWYNCNILWHKSRPTRAVGVSVCRKTPAGYNHHYYDMKKVLHTVIAAALLLSAIFLVSCGENDELSRQAMEYLENKYEKDTFGLSEVPKTKSVTGRYEIKARSEEDGIDFDVYVYAFFITDSYSVTKANIRAEEKIRALLDEETSAAVKSVTVYPVYDDGGTDYRFTSLPLDTEDTLTSIDSIVLNEGEDTSAAAAAVKSITEQLDAGGVRLDRVRFVYESGGYTVNIDTNSEYIMSLDNEAIGEMIGKRIDGALAEAKESDSIFADRSVTVAVDKDSETETEAETEATEQAAKRSR